MTFFAAYSADARAIYVGNVSRVLDNTACHCRSSLAQVDYTTAAAAIGHLFGSDSVTPRCVASHNYMHAPRAICLSLFKCNLPPIAVHAALSHAQQPPHPHEMRQGICVRASYLTPHTSHLTLHTSHLTPHTTPHTSHLTPHTSHLTPHTSHLTPHTSHLTPHTSHLTPRTQYAVR